MENQPMTAPANSLPSPMPAGSSSLPGRHQCDPRIIPTRVELLMGCYRKGEAENPVIYAQALALVLSDYPAEIVERVTDPRTGITGRLKWLPAVAEVREACEKEMIPIREDAYRRLRAAENRLAPIDRSKRPTLAAIQSGRGYVSRRFPDGSHEEQMD